MMRHLLNRNPNAMPRTRAMTRATMFCWGLLCLLQVSASVHAQTLTVQPRHLVFNTVVGQPTAAVQRVRVVGPGTTQVSWTSTASQSWITLSASSGVTPGFHDISVAAQGFSSPGIYEGEVQVSVSGSAEAPQVARVTLIVNPSSGPRPTPWKDGRKGACSISVDDSLPTAYEILRQAGLRGSYFLNGSQAADFFSGFYQSGMEMGSHLLNHFCHEMDETTFRGNIEPNISGISYSTQTPLNEFIGLAWPCGFYTIAEQVIASEYYLFARGYGSNQLEDTTPTDFMNLKGFNSHEHNFPDNDPSMINAVDAAETAGKWANLIFHAELNDDGAVQYSLGKDLWLAPIGSVIKYIHQRDRTVISGYTTSSSSIQFNFRRLALDIPRRFPGESLANTFETALLPDDEITLELDLDSVPEFQGGILQVLLDGIDQPYIIRTDAGKRRLLMNVQPSTADRTVVVVLSPDPTPMLGPLPENLVFAAMEGTDPADQIVQIANVGSGTMPWTARVASSGSPWLQLTPEQGTGNGTFRVSVNTAGLLPGIHAATLLVEAVGAANSPQSIEVNLTLIEAGTQHYDFTYPNRSSLLNGTGWGFVARTAAGQPRDTEVLSGNLAVSYDQATHPGTLRIPAASGQFWAGDNNSINSLFRDLPADWKSIRLKASFHPSPVYVQEPLALQYHQVGLMAYRDDDNYVSITRILNPNLPPHPSDVGFQTYYVHNQVAIIEEVAQAAFTTQFEPFPAASFFLRLDRFDGATLGGLYSVDGETWLDLPTDITHALEGPQFLDPLRLCVYVGGAFPTYPSPPVDLHWLEVVRTVPSYTLRVVSLNPESGVSVLVSRPDQTGATDGITEFTRSYLQGAQVKLTATPVPGRNFQQWRKNGQDIGSNPTVQVTVDGNHTLAAVYTSVPVLRALTINSTPESGVLMAVSPADAGGVSGGPTPLGLSYENGAQVTVNAPQVTVTGHLFDRWVLDGQDMGSNPAIQVTMDAAHALTAVYLAPTLVRTLTVESANPNSGVEISVSPADSNNSSHGTTLFTRTYENGTIVTLTAPATVGPNTFQKWQKNGQDYSSSATAQVTMDDDHTMKAVYVSPSLMKLTVTSANPDRWVLMGVEPADSDGDRAGFTSFSRTYQYGTVVTLKAPANYFGRTFQKWQRNGVDLSTSPTVQVTMDNHYTLHAIYGTTPTVRTLTIGSSNPNSGVSMTVSPADNQGKTSGSTQFSLSYTHGTAVKITAPATVSGNTFQKWQKDGRDFSKDLTVSVTMDANHSLVAVYLAPPSRILTVASANPNSGVPVSLDVTDKNGKRDGSTKFTRVYPHGTVVTLTAPASASGKTFQKWQKNGKDAGTSQSIQATMDADHTFTAVYVTPSLLRTLTIASANPSSGVNIRVSPSDDKGKRDGTTLFTRSYKLGTSVTLKAPSSVDGNKFEKWQRDGVDYSSHANIKITIDADHTFTAVYVTPRVLRTLTVASYNPSEGVVVEVSPSDIHGKGIGSTKFTRSFDKGATVTLQAQDMAPNGKVFQKWQKDGKDAGTARTIQVTMDSDHTLTAVYTTAPTLPLPQPWVTQDIGNVAASGSASWYNDTFTIVGSGSDIWNTSDEFRYAHQVLSGDCTVVARVTAVEYTDSWAKAGVMLRDSLAANAKHASVFLTPANGVAFQSRTGTGSSSLNVNKTGLSAPVWVRIQRAGNTFVGSYSLDGSEWTYLGSQVINMGTQFYVGLAVTSHDDGDRCTARMDNVTLHIPPPNTPPTITALGSQATLVNQATVPAPFLISDAETAAGNLVVAATSSDPALVPDGNIAIGGTDHERTVTIIPAVNKVGNCSITLSVSDGTVSTSTSFDVLVNASVVGRYLFYNRSAYDGDNDAPNAADDGAIATDKVPLLAGQRATFANYSAYSRGINGLMVDIAGLPATLTASDFQFKVGNTDTPGSWSLAPAPSSITVRQGAGVNGSDRVTIIWPDKAIVRQWLEVTVLTTPNTGLTTPSVFYFGNAVGETGDSATDAKINPADELRARNNLRTLLNPAPVDCPFDFNKDKRVDPADQLIARNNQTTVFTALRLLNLTNP